LIAGVFLVLHIPLQQCDGSCQKVWEKSFGNILTEKKSEQPSFCLNTGLSGCSQDLLQFRKNQL
jgi:hypothetical protein